MKEINTGSIGHTDHNVTSVDFELYKLNYGKNEIVLGSFQEKIREVSLYLNVSEGFVIDLIKQNKINIDDKKSIEIYLKKLIHESKKAVNEMIKISQKYNF